MSFSNNKDCCISPDSQSSNNFEIIFNNNINLQINKINNIEYIEENKQKTINSEQINLCNKLTQTEYCTLYEYENKEDIEESIEEKFDKLNKKKRKRKECTDLIRSKLFNYFNKMIYNWIKTSKDKDDKIEIQQFSLKQNNKDNIKEVMSKQLKDLFVSKITTEQITNGLLIKKLDSNYKTLFDYFISDRNKNDENKEFLKNFIFLNKYLESLKGIESDEYINRIRKVAQEYDLWLGKKVHLFKRKTTSI